MKVTRKILGIVAVLAVSAVVVSAGLLTYYGKVETTTNIAQSLRLDGQVYNENENGYADITVENDIGDLVAGCCEWGNCHNLHLHSQACNPVSTEVSSIVSPNDGGLTTMIAAEVQGAGADCSEYTVPTADVTVNTIGDLQTEAAAATPKVIVVEDGTYTGVVNVMNGHTIVAQSHLGATITGGFHIQSDDVTIKGFHIMVNDAIGGGQDKGIYLPGASGVTIECNKFEEVAGANSPRGIVTVMNADYSDIIIKNNDFQAGLSTGMYTNPHTGLLTIMNNDFASGIGGAMGAEITYNHFYPGAGIGVDEYHKVQGYSDRNLVIEYNNFEGDAYIHNYDLAAYAESGEAQDAPDNWWDCDGINTDFDTSPGWIAGSAPVNAGWNTWNDGDIITLQPNETVHFMIQYCTEPNSIGTYTSTVTFLPN